MNLEMTLNRGPGPGQHQVFGWMAAQVTPNNMALEMAQSLNFNKTRGFGPDSRLPGAFGSNMDHGF